MRVELMIERCAVGSAIVPSTEQGCTRSAARPPGHAGAALLLEDRDLKMMSRIVRAQMRRMESGDVVDVAAAAMAEEQLAATA